MKNKRFKYNYRQNASNLHRLIGDTLRGSTALKHYQIYQEYPVNKIYSSFSSGREKFDWVILEIKTVIEVMGEQHYMPVTFGGISKEEAEKNLVENQKRDQLKMNAALAAGWKYITFKYDEAPFICEDFVLNRILSTPWPESTFKDRLDELKEINRRSIIKDTFLQRKKLETNKLLREYKKTPKYRILLEEQRKRRKLSYQSAKSRWLQKGVSDA